MYFRIAVMTLSKSKVREKNCKFETLYLRQYLCDKSEFIGDHRTKTIFCNPWKFTISSVSIFRENVRKEDFFFKFSKSIYFPLGCGIELILGTFWDIPENFLKNIISQLWASYEGSYNGLNIVSTLKFKRCQYKGGPF